MISRAGDVHAGPRKPSALSWWLAPKLTLLWRLPELVLLTVLATWFGFRALVHMAFLFDRYPLGTFLLAPALMPFAAVPAGCFIALIVYVPRLHRAGALSTGWYVFLVTAGPLIALLLAIMIDLLHINLLRLAGVPLPRLPFDPY
ncbi:MAG TPA: hypothetical protein VNK05_06150 [Chloroflexota bacterium]|nr:hypothetical protein [Chloroflexota bacterium]